MKYVWAVLASVVMLNCAAAPLHQGYLALIALVPLLLFQGAPGKHRFLLGWAVGAGLQAGAFSWIFLTIRDFGGVHPALSLVGALLFWLYQGLDFALWFLLYPKLSRRLRLPTPLIAASLWLVIQVFVFPYIFPWVYGAFFVEPGWLAAGAAFWGDQGLGFLAVFTQVLLVARVRQTGPRPTHLLEALALLTLLVLPGLPKAPAPSETWRVAVVQANLIPWAKRNKVSALDIFLAHYETSLKLANQNVDLILWPETAVPFHLAGSGYYENKIRELSLATGAAVATGVIDHPNDDTYYNAVYFYAPGVQEPQIYRKEKLVLFSEHMPVVFGWLRHFVPFLGGFSKGTENQPFDYRNRRLVPLVCYEALFSNYVAGYRGDLLLNFTNDAWFGETRASALHLQQIRMRCLEGRRPMVRATNSGISCWVDTNGAVHEPSALYEKALPIYDVPVGAAATAPWFSIGSKLILYLALLTLLLCLAERVHLLRVGRKLTATP